jgi:hypothetical protein
MRKDKGLNGDLDRLPLLAWIIFLKFLDDESLHCGGLRGPMGLEQLPGQRYGQGKPGLNLSNVRSLSLPFSSLSEPGRIVAELGCLTMQF